MTAQVLQSSYLDKNKQATKSPPEVEESKGSGEKEMAKDKGDLPAEGEAQIQVQKALTKVKESKEVPPKALSG